MKPDIVRPSDVESWRCPKCGSGVDEHRAVSDGPESLEEIVCQRCGTRWPPRPARADPPAAE